MVGRLLAVLIVLYIALDFTNPHMPGAVTFDPAKSIEGVHAERNRGSQPVMITIAAPRPVRLGEASEPQRSQHRLVPLPAPRWHTSLFRRASTPGALAAPSEDH
jgi:hypothetical protein